MKPTNFALTVILAGGVVFGAMALGAQADDGSITFGSQRLRQNAPEAKYQEFSDLPRGPYIDNFAWREAAGRRLCTITGSRALRDDQTTELRYADGVRWGLDIGYTRTPHNISWVTRTPYYETSPGVFTLPDSLQAKTQAANSAAYTALMNDFLNNAHRQNMGFRTDLSRVRLRGRPARGWQFDVVGTERRRTGSKPYAVTFGFSNDVELPEPIDQRMLNADASASYSDDRMRVRLSGGVSTFTNHVDKLIVDNPKRLSDSPTAGSGRGLLDLYPNNRSIRGSVDAAYTLPQRTLLSASVTLSHDTQKDDWLPYTINSAVLDTLSAALPGTKTDAKATVISQNYRLTSRALDKVTGVLRYQRSKYDNKTPTYVFPGIVVYDQSYAAGPDETSAPGHQVATSGFDVDFEPMDLVTLSGTAEYVQSERGDREVEKNNETVLYGQARVRPADGVNLKASFRHGNRKVDSFDLDAYDGLEQPGLRRFDVAARKQNKADVGLSWVPFGKGLVSGCYTYLKNNYDQSDLGLHEETQQVASLDFTHRPTDRIDLSGGLGGAQMKTIQRSVQSGSASLAAPADSGWTAEIKNWSIHAYGNLEVEAVPQKVTLMGGLEYERAPTSFRFTNVHATSQDLPNTRYRKRDLTFAGYYRVDSSTQLGLRYDLEKFDAQDFAAQNITLLNPPSGSANAIFLGDNVQNYTANRVTLMMKRTF